MNLSKISKYIPDFSILEKVCFGLLLGMVFLIPLFFIPGGFISVQFGSSLLFASLSILCFLLYIILKLKAGSLEMPKSLINFLGLFVMVPLFYLISFLVNSISSGFSRTAFLGYTFDVSTVGFILLSFVFMYLVSLIFNSQARIFYSLLALVFSSLIFALFLVVRIVAGPGFASFGVFTALTNTVIGSWDSAGIFFGICVILSLITHELLSVTRFMKIIVSVALLVSLLFLMLINFVSVWIIVAIMSLLFIFYKLFSPNFFLAKGDPWSERIQKVSKYSVAVFVISLIFIFWGNVLSNGIANTLNVSNLDVRPSLSVTYDIAKNTLQSKPLFGSGPNTFLLQWLSYKPIDVNNTVFWNTDFSYGVGLLPTFIVTTGLLGLLSWLVFFALYLYLGFKSFFLKEDDVFSKYLGVASFFISLYLWIMCCVYVPGVVIVVLTLFFTGLFFAHLYNTGVLEKKTILFSSNPKVGFVSSLVLVMLFVGGLFLAHSLYKNFVSLWYFQKASYAASISGNVADAEGSLTKAINEVPYDLYYRAQVDISVSKLQALFSTDLSKANKTDVQKFFSTELSKAIQAGLNARNADSSNYLNWISLGEAYEVAASPQIKITGAYDSAHTAYMEAQKRNAQNPIINLLLARLEMGQGNFKGAEAYALLAIKQKQNYLDAYFLLTQIEVSNNNVKGAIDSTTMAAVIDPTNPSTFFQLGLLKYNSADYAGAVQALQKSIQIAPDYANAKYFLGLSLFQTGDTAGAVQQFKDLEKSNPGNVQVGLILSNLLSGKQPFAGAKPPVTATPEKASTLPIQQTN